MFSERLRQLRINLNLNKRQMARRLGLPYSTYNHYELGREPNANLLLLLSKEFGVSTDYLLGRDTGVPIGEQDGDMFKLYNRLNEIGRYKTKEYMRDLLKNACYQNSGADADASENGNAKVHCWAIAYGGETVYCSISEKQHQEIQKILKRTKALSSQ